MNEHDTADVPEALSVSTVILASDGSTESFAALPTARALRERFGARLVVLSVAKDADHARMLHEEAAAALGDPTDHESIEVIIGDDPAAAIVERSETEPGSLVSMATRGRGRIAGALIGSVARSVVRQSSRPVVVVGPHADRPGWLVGRPRRRPADWPEPLSAGGVVAFVDGSADAESSLPAAVRWADALDAPLSIVTVAEDAPADSKGVRPNRFGPADPQRYVDELAARWRAARPDTVGTVVYDPIGVASGVRSHLAARPVGLIALTAHARTGLDRLRHGAASAQIVAASTVPVLVVPVGSDEDSDLAVDASIDEVPVTVTEAVTVMREHGYVEDFELVDGALRSSGGNDPCPIGEAVVERVYRFEGPSDPGDQMIVFGLLDPISNVRGTLAAAYGPAADPALYDHLTDLSTRQN